MLLSLLGNNPRLVRNKIINFVIFENKKTLGLFNLDIGPILD